MLKKYPLISLIVLFITTLNLNASELLTLLAEDQKAREPIYTLPRDEVKAYIQNVMLPGDKVRREEVIKLMASKPSLNADEYFAAAMIMQHGYSAEDAKNAMQYAINAIEKDSSHEQAKWLKCASEDRYLQRSGKAQVWGTQLSRKKHPTADYDILYPANFDRTQKTDKQREGCNLPSYAEIDHRLIEMASVSKRSEQMKIWKRTN